MALRFVNPAPRYFDNEGHLLSYGRLYFYEPGTKVAKNTFSDPQLTVVNSNPVELFGDGLQPDIFGTGGYRVICTDQYDREIFDRDNVSVLLFPFSEWNSSTTYGEGAGNIVTGSDGEYYVSLGSDNVGNDPVSSPSEWEMISFFPGSEAEAENVIEMGELIPADQSILVGNGAEWTVQPIAYYLYAYLQGLETANGTDADHDIDVDPGVCADSTSARMMTLEAAMTKRIDATWVAGTGNGGLASGATLSTNSSYHLFLVDVNGVIDVMFDSSVTCANGVANNSVDYFRRIASMTTDSSANIVPYIQKGDLFTLMSSVNNLDNTISETTALIDVSVPEGISFLATIGSTAMIAAGSPFSYLVLDSPLTTEIPSPDDSNSTIFLTISALESASSVQIQILTDTSARIRLKFSQSGSPVNMYVAINTIGWEDNRGK